MFFYIYIDNQIGDRDYGEEYDIIEDAVEKMVSKYNELYGLDIYIDMDICFLDDKYYQQLVDEYDDVNADLKELLNHSTNIRMQMGNPKDYVTKDLWLSREEYICARENMR